MAPAATHSGSQTPLLSNRTAPADSSPPNYQDDAASSSAVRRRLFVSHFLSTWNSRVFEFGSVLYLASIYPGTLLPMSVYALARGASAIFFSPAIGRYIDTGDRLQVVRLSIVLQRLVVAASCVIFWFLAGGWQWARSLGPGALAILAVLACVEKLCSIMNLVSVEKDWVVVLAGNNERSLRELNAQMRRIDLVCKLAGPFFISIIDGISTETAILVNLAMNLTSIVVEYYAIARVYKLVPALQEPKAAPRNEPIPDQGRIARNWNHLTDGVRATLREYHAYFHHRAFLPSFAGALLYFTVLSFAGQMITYLLSTGYNSMHIGIARTASVAFEMSATWITPKVMSRIGPIRTGIWFISWQMMCLAAGGSLFWAAQQPLLSASGLVVGTILSRVGLWGFDLSVQVIVQEEVEPESRGSFSSVEASWQNAFELCSYTTTVIFARPDQFRWPTLMSCIAVFTSGGLYTAFVRSRRGHLLHLSRCVERRKNSVDSGYERIVQSPNV